MVVVGERKIRKVKWLFPAIFAQKIRWAAPVYLAPLPPQPNLFTHGNVECLRHLSSVASRASLKKLDSNFQRASLSSWGPTVRGNRTSSTPSNGCWANRARKACAAKTCPTSFSRAPAGPTDGVRPTRPKPPSYWKTRIVNSISTPMKSTSAAASIAAAKQNT